VTYKFKPDQNSQILHPSLHPTNLIDLTISPATSPEVIILHQILPKSIVSYETTLHERRIPLPEF
jgi:hypothetical protein